MNNEEKIHKKLLDDLKNLPKVEAPKNFETELWRKINSSEEINKESFWEKLFSPGKLVPAAIAIVSAAIIFFVIDLKPRDVEDPLNIAPRLREDLIVYNSVDEITVRKNEEKVVKKQKSKTEETKGLLENKKESRRLEKSNQTETLSKANIDSEDKDITVGVGAYRIDTNSNKLDAGRNLGKSAAPVTIKEPDVEISKNSLNFMQINQTVQEKAEVQQLKMKIESQKSVKSGENRAKSTNK
jgi:hypothetical protein